MEEAPRASRDPQPKAGIGHDDRTVFTDPRGAAGDELLQIVIEGIHLHHLSRRHSAAVGHLNPDGRIEFNAGWLQCANYGWCRSVRRRHGHFIAMHLLTESDDPLRTVRKSGGMRKDSISNSGHFLSGSGHVFITAHDFGIVHIELRKVDRAA